MNALLDRSRVEVLTREEWLSLHYDREHVSASQVASVLGVSPYETPLHLYALRRGEVDRPDESLPMKLGKVLEPIVCDLYAESTGRIIEDLGATAIIRHPELPALFCTLDRLTVAPRGEGCLEAKTTGSFARKEWQEEAPMHHLVQHQVQMFCAGLQFGSLAALIGNSDFLVHDFERMDDTFEEGILKRCAAFLDAMKRGEPPTPTYADRGTILQMHPMDNGVIITGDEADEDMIAEFEAARATAKSADDILERAKNALALRIGDSTGISVDGRTVTYKHQSRRTKAQVEGADVHLLDQYGIPYTPGKETTFRVLRVGK